VLVVDTSAVLHALVARPADPDLVTRLTEDDDWHAPHAIDVEILHALRGLVLGSKIGAGRAGEALTDFADLRIRRYPHAPLVERAWELRSNLTAYDAVFMALSEMLDAPLVTCDSAMGKAKTQAVVEVYGTGRARRRGR